MKNQKLNLISLYFLVVAVGVIFLIVYFITCLVFFYGHTSNEIVIDGLYCLFVISHLLVNVFVIAKPQKFTAIHRIISSICVLCLYIAVAIIYL